MFRILLSALLFTGTLPFLPAQDLPKFPQQNHVTTAEHVKEFWMRTARWQAHHTRSAQRRDDQRRLVKRIEAGLYDERAELAALRSNLAYLEFKERFVAVRSVRKRIAALEHSLLLRRLAAQDAEPRAVEVGAVVDGAGRHLVAALAPTEVGVAVDRVSGVVAPGVGGLGRGP